MCVGSAMPVATLPVTAHRDRLSEWGNRSTHMVYEWLWRYITCPYNMLNSCMKVVWVLFIWK